MARTPGTKPLSKQALFGELAQLAGLSEKQIEDVFDGLKKILERELGKQGPGVVLLGDLLELVALHKPAMRARTGPNPFVPGETITFPAKPARTTIKARCLKALLDLV
jgi:hypothetical protein